MRRLIASSLILGCLSVPASAFALEGIGPRVTIVGTVEQKILSDKQTFDKEGGEFIIRASNNQRVTVVADKYTVIITEGQSSRRQLVPNDIQVGMQVRVRGWRGGTDNLTASLFIITNYSNNPILTLNGTLQSVDVTGISVLLDSGEVRKFSVTNETDVNISYTLTGINALSLIGKQVILTLNPRDNTQVRNIRITGDKPLQRGWAPTSVELQRR